MRRREASSAHKPSGANQDVDAPSLPLETWVRPSGKRRPRPTRDRGRTKQAYSVYPLHCLRWRKGAGKVGSAIRSGRRPASLSLPGKCEPPTNNAPGAGGGGEASQANNQYQHGGYGKEGERREKEGDGMRPRAPVGRLPCKSKTAEIRRTEGRTGADGWPERMRTEG